MLGRIRRGRALPSRPLREHRGSRGRARFREKNAPLRSKTREILFKLSISVLRQLRKSFDRGFGSAAQHSTLSWVLAEGGKRGVSGGREGGGLGGACCVASKAFHRRRRRLAYRRAMAHAYAMHAYITLNITLDAVSYMIL